MGAARERVEQGIEMWNNGDFDRLQTLMADDQVWVSPTGRLTGSEAIVNRYRADLTAFPDRRLQVSKWVEEGDTVVVEYEWTGTHNGPLSLPDGAELAPTGQRITLLGVDVLEVRDGKTVAHRTYFDQLTVMIQVGVVAPTPQP
jgi:steroid delta-isomerase-like uncharacterized protein